MRLSAHVIVLAVLAIMFPVRSAYAYLDPGTASMLLQGLIGGIAASAAVIGLYWSKFKRLFTTFISRRSKDRERRAED